MRDILRLCKHTPVRTVVKKILNTDSTMILNEATKALRNFALNEKASKLLMDENQN